MQNNSTTPSTTYFHWARLRLHVPYIIYDWHQTESAARAAIDISAAKHGQQVYKSQTVAYFPDKDETQGMVDAALASERLGW